MVSYTLDVYEYLTWSFLTATGPMIEPHIPHASLMVNIYWDPLKYLTQPYVSHIPYVNHMYTPIHVRYAMYTYGVSHRRVGYTHTENIQPSL